MHVSLSALEKALRLVDDLAETDDPADSASARFRAWTSLSAAIASPTTRSGPHQVGWSPASYQNKVA